MDQYPTLSAADLQRRHALEGTAEPFLENSVDSPVKPKAVVNAPLDTDSPISFPSLAPSAPVAQNNGAAKSGWGAGPRIKPTVNKQSMVTDSIDVIDVHVPAGDDGKPGSLGAIMRAVMNKYKVKVEASTNRTNRQTTFHLKAETEKELERGKRMLLTAVSPQVTQVVDAPASAIASIIGTKGATLKQIRDQTGVKIDIPRRDTTVPATNGNVKDNAGDDEEEEITIPITVSGAQAMVYEAVAMLNAIASSKASKTVQRVRDIPANVLPFVTVRRTTFLAAAGGEVALKLNAPEREITVTGDRESVARAIEAIKGTVEAFKSSIVSLKITLPKRQHRLLSGKAADEIMASAKCAIITSSPDDPSEEVTVWGKATDLGNGVGAVMQKANSQYIHEFPLPGPFAVSKQMLTYMIRANLPKSWATNNPGADVYTPSLSVTDKGQTLNLDIVGDKPAVDGIVKQISELIGKLYGGTREVTVDWLIHRVIMGKNAKKIKQFHDVQNVLVYFPHENAEHSTVLLVYDPFSPSASPSPVDKEKSLGEVAKEILKMAKDAADVASVTIPVEQKWHDAVVGRNGTTLNAIVGEDKTLSIKLGADAGDSSTQDVILVRGATADVNRVVKEINDIVDKASKDAIVSSHSIEFDVDREYVARIVGAQGVGINKLRDQLGVKVDVTDDHDDKDKDASKKKKNSSHQKSKITITGREENVVEAKKRILGQIEKLADETSEVLKIANQYHSSLIGQNGKWAIRLEEKYSVKITFPRQSADHGDKTREQLKPDEVLVKGGKKGVAGAKAELIEAVDFEKESNNVIKFDVPTRTVARILGRGGATINEIKNNTDAQIDVDKGDGPASADTTITLRGSKKAIAAAKAAILEITNTIGEEVTVVLDIESKYHRTIIGAGGQGLKSLVERCGGPSDPRAMAGLLRFPRQGEPSNEVKLRGEPKLVAKLKADLEKIVADLRDRVVLAVEVPASQHRALIGRGGQHLNDLQARCGALVQFPGSRSYSQVGEAENIGDFPDVPPADIVKVSGPRAACEKAIVELKSLIKPQAAAVAEITETVSIPLKYHHIISQQGNFFRTLRSYGAHVDQSAHPQKAATPPQPPAGTPSARIDDEDEASGVQWQTTSNYQDAEEGVSEWTVKAKDQESLNRAVKAVKDAAAHAAAMSHLGFLTLADRSSFPRLVGTKGATVSRLRSETGADITISREDPTIVIAGSESAIAAAKEAILKVVNMPAGRGPRRDF